MSSPGTRLPSSETAQAMPQSQWKLKGGTPVKAPSRRQVGGGWRERTEWAAGPGAWASRSLTHARLLEARSSANRASSVTAWAAS